MTDKIKRSFFQAAVVSVLLYGCTTWTLTLRMKKNLTATTQECCEQYLSSPGDSTITKTIRIRRTRHAGHCWRSRDELISDVLLWTPSHGRAKAERPARTYIQHHCTDTGCIPEVLLEAMGDWEESRERERERERGRESHGYPRWWRVMMIYIYIYI